MTATTSGGGNIGLAGQNGCVGQNAAPGQSLPRGDRSEGSSETSGTSCRRTEMEWDDESNWSGSAMSDQSSCPGDVVSTEPNQT